MTKTTATLLALSSLSACTAQVGVHEAIDLPKDSAATCAQQCDDLGLVFEGVALVGTSVACLCAPHGAQTRKSMRQAGAIFALLSQEQDQEAPTLP
jgi:hypothetical protein